MHVALQAIGREPKLDDLIDQRYISSSFGSTLADLQKIADDYQVAAVPMRGMTVGMLRDSTSPVVLHTRRPRRGSPYQHWIVYLGVENGMAKIIDPPSAQTVCAFSEILAQWDGVGLLVSAEPISLPRINRAAWLEQATAVLSTLCAIFAVAALFATRSQRPYVRAIQTGALLILSVAVAVGYHAASGDGFVRNRDAVASVVTTHHAGNVPELSLRMLMGKLRDKPVLVDARLASDFSEGSLPGAVSFPINSTSAERARFFSSLPKDKEYIVFCKSNECRWSDELASEMVLRGFAYVSVYRGGYDQWRNSVESGD